MKGKSNIAEALNNLEQTDVYSLILFALYKLKDVPEYSTLSELCYILDGKDLITFLDYYGGSTIRVPTKKELAEVIDGLLLYEEVNMEGKDFSEALKDIDTKDIPKIKSTYLQISQLLQSYNLRRK